MSVTRTCHDCGDCRRGSELVEAMVMTIPFFALVFLIINTAWGLFIRATMQFAVHEGVRYGITGQTSNGNGQAASIEGVVQTESMGLLSGPSAVVSVSYLDPVTLTTASNANAIGNVVQVSATYLFYPLVPFFGSNGLNLSASAADVLEGFPGTTPPSP